ncbi:MAG: NHLP leader peptide family RiPP precursor [Pseudomonadota bacterium]
MSLAKAIARAWHDAAYKAKLQSDPHGALAEVGVTVPAGAKVHVFENDADNHHIVLPEAPPHTGKMSRYELEELASTMLMRGNVM